MFLIHFSFTTSSPIVQFPSIKQAKISEYASLIACGIPLEYAKILPSDILAKCACVYSCATISNDAIATPSLNLKKYPFCLSF